jgi:hypothetical protein
MITNDESLEGLQGFHLSPKFRRGRYVRVTVLSLVEAAPAAFIQRHSA